MFILTMIEVIKDVIAKKSKNDEDQEENLYDLEDEENEELDTEMEEEEDWGIVPEPEELGQPQTILDRWLNGNKNYENER